LDTYYSKIKWELQNKQPKFNINLYASPLSCEDFISNQVKKLINKTFFIHPQNRLYNLIYIKWIMVKKMGKIVNFLLFKKHSAFFI
jgi:hypothetical protein